MKIKSLLLLGLSVGIMGLVHSDTAQASSPWINITDKSVPRTDFVDISSHNGIPSVAEFKIMKSYGVKGVMIKLTEATSYRNDFAPAQVANAKAAGLRVGAYHYSWYANPAQARIEGQYFAQFAKELGLAKNTPMADDLEEPTMISANTNGRVNANVKAFRAGVASQGYTNNILYTYASYSTQTNLNEAAFGKRKVWMASYPFTPSKDYLWHTDVGMWQFNSNMHFPNVRGTFDANIDYAGVMSPKKKAAKKKAPKLVNPKNVNMSMKFDQKKRNDGLYANAPYAYKGAKFVGRATHGTKVKVEKTETARNGVVWYYGKVNGQYVWFDAKAVVKMPKKKAPAIANLTNVNKMYVANQAGRNDTLYMAAPKGYRGSKSVGKMPTKRSIYVKKQMVGKDNTLWYYGRVNGKNLWFNAKGVKVKPAPFKLNTKAVNKMYMANQVRRNDRLFSNMPNGYRGTKYAGQMPKKRSIFVQKKFVDRNNKVWYYGRVNGQNVWFEAKGVKAKPLPAKAAASTVKKAPAKKVTKKKVVKKTPAKKAAPKKVVKKAPAKKAAPKKVVKKAPAKKVASVLDVENANAQQLDANFVFDQTKRKDDLYKFSPRDEAGSEKLREAVDGEVVHVIGQFVAEDDTIWYNTEIDGESVWFEAKAGRLEV